MLRWFLAQVNLGRLERRLGDILGREGRGGRMLRDLEGGKERGGCLLELC
jgi:hypothetical protein